MAVPSLSPAAPMVSAASVTVLQSEPRLKVTVTSAVPAGMVKLYCVPRSSSRVSVGEVPSEAVT